MCTRCRQHAQVLSDLCLICQAKQLPVRPNTLRTFLQWFSLLEVPQPHDRITVPAKRG